MIIVSLALIIIGLIMIICSVEDIVNYLPLISLAIIVVGGFAIFLRAVYGLIHLDDKEERIRRQIQQWERDKMNND